MVHPYVERGFSDLQLVSHVTGEIDGRSDLRIAILQSDDFYFLPMWDEGVELGLTAHRLCRTIGRVVQTMPHLVRATFHGVIGTVGDLGRV